MKWGLYDTEKNGWMGTDDGPRLYDNELLARVAAQLLDTQLGQAPGRTRQREYDESGVREVEHENQPSMTMREALKRTVRGEL